MFDIEKLVTANTRVQILQHLRSELNVGSLKYSEIEDLEFTDMIITAFATEYRFNLVYTREDTGIAESSLIDLGGVKPQAPKVTSQAYSGSIAEILEPGAEFPVFEVSFIKV